jgi:hypothetical protein
MTALCRRRSPFGQTRSGKLPGFRGAPAQRGHEPDEEAADKPTGSGQRFLGPCFDDALFGRFAQDRDEVLFRFRRALTC